MYTFTEQTILIASCGRLRSVDATMNSAKSEYYVRDFLPGAGPDMRIACKL